MRGRTGQTTLPPLHSSGTLPPRHWREGKQFTRSMDGDSIIVYVYVSVSVSVVREQEKRDKNQQIF